MKNGTPALDFSNRVEKMKFSSRLSLESFRAVELSVATLQVRTFRRKEGARSRFATTVRDALFDEDQLAVAGHPQAVGLLVVLDQDFASAMQ